MKTVVIASNNAHKIDEIRAALDFEGWEFASLKEAGVASDPEENAETFEGNARIKARAAHEVSGRAFSLTIQVWKSMPCKASLEYARRAMRACTETTPPTIASCLKSLREFRMLSVRHGSCAHSCSWTKTALSLPRGERWKVASATRRRERKDSATIPCSFRTILAVPARLLRFRKAKRRLSRTAAVP